MAVVEADMVLVKPASVPTTDVATTGGAATTTQITGSVVGELIPTQTANAVGGGDIVWYYKLFLKNNAGSGNFETGKFWVSNLLLDIAVNGVFQFQSSSASDDTDYECIVYGLDAAGNNTSEIIVLNGTNIVTGSTTFSKLYCIEVIDVVSGALSVLNGILTVTRGTVLGYIPASCDYAFSAVELQIAKEAAKNGSDSAANRLTAPAGEAFSTALTEATGLALDDLTPGDVHGIWIMMTAPDGRARQSQERIYFRYSGSV